MIVKICDALCGAGKTSSCINMMNEEVDKKYIFVTQFLSEVDRIKSACSVRGFVSPDGNMSIGQTKLSDIHRLLEKGENIATTHSLFVSYTDETKELIRKHNYVLVLDESVDIFSMSHMSKDDMKILLRSKTVVDRKDHYEWLLEDYGNDENARFKEEMLRAKSKNFLKYDDEYFFWAIPPELFTCFNEAYVLTYMFYAQPLRSFLELYDIPYEYIGTKKNGDRYEFCDVGEMDRKRDLRKKIHIIGDMKLNEIGKNRTALSMSWYQKARAEDGKANLDRLRKNISNIFKNIFHAKLGESMWTTFVEFKRDIYGYGYGKSFVVYNKRASNEYRDRKYLAYCVNNFPRPWESRYFRDHGVSMDGDMYALSILVQWIFRSAIRDGEDIWVYIPSLRMRTLLTRWIDNLAEGKDTEIIKYVASRKKNNTCNKRGRPLGSRNKKTKGKKHYV